MLVDSVVTTRQSVPAEMKPSFRTTAKPRVTTMGVQGKGNPWLISIFCLVVFLLAWHFFTLQPTFDSRGMTEEQLQMMEFNGDIVRTATGTYDWNPEKQKVKGVPGPLAALVVEENQRSSMPPRCAPSA